MANVPGSRSRPPARPGTSTPVPNLDKLQVESACGPSRSARRSRPALIIRPYPSSARASAAAWPRARCSRARRDPEPAVDLTEIQVQRRIPAAHRPGHAGSPGPLVCHRAGRLQCTKVPDQLVVQVVRRPWTPPTGNGDRRPYRQTPDNTDRIRPRHPGPSRLPGINSGNALHPWGEAACAHTAVSPPIPARPPGSRPGPALRRLSTTPHQCPGPLPDPMPRKPCIAADVARTAAST